VVVKNAGVSYTSGGIFYNMFIDCGGITGIRIKGVKDIKVYGNTVFTNTLTGAYFALYVGVNGAGENATGCDVKNNIFAGSPSGALICVETASMSGFLSDYNIDYRQSGTAIGYDGTTIYTWATWQGLGYEAHGQNINPLLSASYVPVLGSGSPAIDTGVDLTATYNAAKNGTQGALWDIGANVAA